MRLDQRRRLLIALSLGAAAGTSPPSSVHGSWRVSRVGRSRLFVAGSVWTFLAVLGATATKQVATREDDSRAGVDIIMVVACLISLIGVVVGLAHRKRRPGPTRQSSRASPFSPSSCRGSRFTPCSCCATHASTTPTPPGGIEFADNEEPPDYMDFVYIAFTVGMTFQVSDTGIAQRNIRRTVIRHALLSYVFGTLIIGIAINVVGNLIR